MVQLRQDILEFCRDRQADVSGVLKQGLSFVTQIETNHRAAQCTASSYHMNVNGICNAHHDQDKGFLAYSLEAHSTGQLFIQDSAHDTGDIVQHHEDDERDQQAIQASLKVAEPAANSHAGSLDLSPEQVNRKITHSTFPLLKLVILKKPRFRSPFIFGLYSFYTPIAIQSLSRKVP